MLFIGTDEVEMACIGSGRVYLDADIDNIYVKNTALTFANEAVHTPYTDLLNPFAFCNTRPQPFHGMPTCT